MADDLEIDAEHVVPGHALTWTAARASGPGGQHVNRTESKVHLTLDTNQVFWLVGPVRTRLLALAGQKANAQGLVLVTCQEHREQSRNLDAARARVADMIRMALVRPKRRVPTKPTKGSIRRRLEDKRRTSLKKLERNRKGDD